MYVHISAIRGIDTTHFDFLHSTVSDKTFATEI